jgi:D-alanyl-D-alanine dipeptidase
MLFCIQEGKMKKIIYIADPEILAIPITENNEPMIDIKSRTELKYGPPPENILTKDCYTKLRKTVFDKLCEAQKELPHGWRFRIYEGFRSLKVQQMLFEQEFARVSKNQPTWSKAEVFRETTRLVSPVVNYDQSQNIPPHNTGGAFDIELIDTDNQLIDMGMEAKDWGVVDPDLCLTHCRRLTHQQKRNRRILLELLESFGFVNYPNEWWHFSYGDRYWAYHTHHTDAIYGSADAIKIIHQLQPAAKNEINLLATMH